MAPSPLLSRMRGDVPGALWPPVFSTRKSSLVALIHELDRTQWFGPETVAAGQRRQLAALLGHFERHSPRFRERLEAVGLTAGEAAGNPSRLPPLTRRELQRDPGPVTAEALPAGHAPTKLMQTSGSTGEPVKVFKTAVSQLFWSALTLRYHFWHEPDFGGRSAAVRALVKDPGEKASWGGLFDNFFDTGPALRIDNGTDLAEQLRLLREFRPTSLMIYPSNLAAMMDRMERDGADFPGLKRVRTIGETLSPALRERAEAQLGVTVRDCYSSEELGYIAVECPEGGLYHVMAETLLVEVLDEEGKPCREGEVGRVVATDLQNFATPVIRYAIGDYAEVGPPCPCGRGLPTLRRILGRERNMIVLPDGRTHWPITGFKRLRGIAPILQYQYVQHAPARVEVRLVTEGSLSAEQERALADLIRDYLGHPFEIGFTYFEDRLPVGANGKFEEVVSLVKR